MKRVGGRLEAKEKDQQAEDTSSVTCLQPPASICALPTLRPPTCNLRLFFITCLFLITALALTSLDSSAQIKLAWDPNTEADLAGYRIYYGTASRTYGAPIDVGNVTTYTLNGLTPGVTYYIAVTAHDKDGNESGYSNEVFGVVAEAVTVPPVLGGPTIGVMGSPYTYTAEGSISNLGHPVEYQFDWKGDGADLSGWGAGALSKIWTVAGSYNIKARARCSRDHSVVSGWSASLSVGISVPQASATPAAYDFGKVKVKRSKATSLKVKNSGTANLLMSTSIVEGADASMFTITIGGGSKTIKPGKTFSLRVAFKPTSAGTKSSVLRIVSNDPQAPHLDVPLSGAGE